MVKVGKYIKPVTFDCMSINGKKYWKAENLNWRHYFKERKKK